MSVLPRLSPQDLKVVVFDKFKAIYGYYGAPGYKESPEIFTRIWLDKLRFMSKAQLERGVGSWLTDKKDKWPTVGQFLSAVLESQPQKLYDGIDAEEPREDEEWFAFPPQPGDVTGPRYRLMVVETGRAKGLPTVRDVECPVEGCRCCAVEVFLRPQEMGIKPELHFKVARSAHALDESSHPVGWRWMHYAQQENLTLCPKVRA